MKIAALEPMKIIESDEFDFQIELDELSQENLEVSPTQSIADDSTGSSTEDSKEGHVVRLADFIKNYKKKLNQKEQKALHPKYSKALKAYNWLDQKEYLATQKAVHLQKVV